MRTVPLSAWVHELESGARPKGGIKDGVGEIPSLGAEHLADDGGFNFAKDKRVPYEFFRTMKKGRIQHEDILIVKDGATTGKISFVNRDFPYEEAAINEHVFRLKISRKKADPRFVFRYLQSPLGQQQIMSDFRGATVGGIGRTFLDKVFVPDVVISEQHRIAAILDKADAIRRKREGAIVLADKFLRSVFLEMFGDPTKAPSNFGTRPLGQLVDQKRGISYGIVQRGVHDQDGIPIVRITDIAGNVLRDTQLVRASKNLSSKYRRTILKGGELLLSIRGTVGRVAIAPSTAKGYNVSREVAVIPLLPNVDPSFVRALMLTDGAQKFMTDNVKGVAQSGINLKDVRLLPVPDAPPALLSRFLKVLAAADRIRKNSCEPAPLLESLSQRAFCGEL